MLRVEHQTPDVLWLSLTWFLIEVQDVAHIGVTMVYKVQSSQNEVNLGQALSLSTVILAPGISEIIILTDPGEIKLSMSRT